eukprot:1494169-Pleurochrysis_carterae.AAC.1
MAVQRCGAPSTPRTEVPHGTALIKSPMHGWMWCVQPLSITNAMCFECGGRCRESIGEASGQSRGRVGCLGESAVGENGVAVAALERRWLAPLNRGA